MGQKKGNDIIAISESLPINLFLTYFTSVSFGKPRQCLSFHLKNNFNMLCVIGSYTFDKFLIRHNLTKEHPAYHFPFHPMCVNIKTANPAVETWG